MKIPAERRQGALAYRRQHFFHFLDQRGAVFWALLGLPLTLVVAWVDLLTGYEYAFSLFYLAPISLAAWYAGRRVGVPMAILSGFMWVTADVLTGRAYSSQTVIIWNTVIRTSVFLLVGLLVSDLRRAMHAERRLSRTDGLTGAINSRHFADLLGSEIERARRFARPFTLAFIDLDNFKRVNDIHGHGAGDMALAAVAAALLGGLRSTDLLARLGGDEFAILLVEAGSAEARDVLERARAAVLDAMRARGWPVTLSIGAVTFLHPPPSAEKAVALADHLMYDVKSSGKDRLALADYTSRDE